MDIFIFHNPKCSHSRQVLALIRQKGIEPEIIEYLKQPLKRDELKALVEKMGGKVRDILRDKESLCAELGLNDAHVSDDEIYHSIERHPILMARPIVRKGQKALLCRPPERVHLLLNQDKP